MPHVKTGKILLLIFRNVIKAYELFRDGQPQDKVAMVHGYINNYSFVMHYPSYEVELLQPLEDCFKESS